jgi:UDP-glucose 4-epimerase
MDIRTAEVIELMGHRRPEVVFHLAAQADVRVSVADPVFDADVNVLGTLRVLEGARTSGAGRVVFAASGGTLYGEPDASELPLKESLPHRPLSPYGVSKKSAIDYLVAYRELHSLEFAALALANVYGPRQNPHGEAGVVAIFADRILRGAPITIFGDGEQTRDFVYVDDVVDAFVRGATKGGGLICNIGTGRETSVNELVREMSTQANVEVTSNFEPLRPGELQRSALDPSRAGIQLGWRSWTGLGTGSGAVLKFIEKRQASTEEG